MRPHRRNFTYNQGTKHLSFSPGRSLPQQYRPPRQTSAQAKYRAALVTSVAHESEAQRSYVLGLMSSVVAPACSGLPCERATASELLQRRDWEWEHDWILHNAPADSHVTLPGSLMIRTWPLH